MFSLEGAGSLAAAILSAKESFLGTAMQKSIF